MCTARWRLLTRHGPRSVILMCDPVGPRHGAEPDGMTSRRQRVDEVASSPRARCRAAPQELGNLTRERESAPHPPEIPMAHDVEWQQPHTVAPGDSARLLQAGSAGQFQLCSISEAHPDGSAVRYATADPGQVAKIHDEIRVVSRRVERRAPPTRIDEWCVQAPCTTAERRCGDSAACPTGQIIQSCL